MLTKKADSFSVKNQEEELEQLEAEAKRIANSAHAIFLQELAKFRNTENTRDDNTEEASCSARNRALNS